MNNDRDASLIGDAEAGLEDPDLYNADLAPVPFARRTWTVWNFAALWISMSACIPTYLLASSLIKRRHELVAGRPHRFSSAT